jgi:hypothetical protein
MKQKLQNRFILQNKLYLIVILVTAFIETEINAQSAYIENVPYEIAPIDAPFDMPAFKRPTFPDKTFNILEFGAKEMGHDKSEKCTEAIHRAIDAAYNAGGGKVLVPEGDWLTGPIHLKSNINLHLDDGASIYFSEDKKDYLPVVYQRSEGVEVYNYSPLIYANKVKNVAITGKGVLEGQGQHWRDWWRDWGTDQGRDEATKLPLSRRKNYGKGAGKEGLRPSFVVFWKSENILIEGITLNESPMWNVHLIYTQKAIVRNITVNSRESHNGDGIVLDSSKDLLIEYNHLKTGDDAIVIKSGLNEEGLEINIPTENVVIRNFYAYDVRTGSGGVVFGSETSGGIRNIYVHDAFFEKCDRGIRFKTARGRGNITENIYVRNIRLKNIEQEAINFNTFYSGSDAVGPSPLIRNVDIRDIYIDGVPKPIVLIGLPEKWLENIHLENIDVINAKEGARITRVKNLTLKNVDIESDERALEIEDAFECRLEKITLKDKVDKPSLLLKGQHTGAVYILGYSLNRIEFGDGLGEDIIWNQLPSLGW